MKARHRIEKRGIDHHSAVGKRLVADSADHPRAALRFLGDPALTRRGSPAVGTPPGAMVVSADSPETVLRIMIYGSGSFRELTLNDPNALPELLRDPNTIAWIDIEGFGNQDVLEEVGRVLEIHPLAMADVVHTPQRPKAEMYDDRLLVVTQMARVTETDDVDFLQVSLVLGPGWVASFKECTGDVFDPIRARIRSQTARISHQGADFLIYTLIDAVIDAYFPVVEALGGVVEALEEEVIEQASRASLARIHATRRTLLTLRRVQWRQRDAINTLLRDDTLPFTDELMPYLRDAHDHAHQTLDAIEANREMVIGLMDLYLSSASHRMNEVMKTLTIVATIFIPLTFLSGIYGMNFDHMPELHWKWGYSITWSLMLSVAASLLFWFRRRGWIGGASAGNEDHGSAAATASRSRQASE